MTVDSIRGHVLVADDDDGVRRVLERALTNVGYSVCAVSNGEDAIRAFEEHSFDLVLSDIDMPGRNGIQVLRAIRARDLDIPVVLLTGGARLETAIAAVEYGASHYLTKPVNVPGLHDTIRRAMQAGRLARARRNLVGLSREGLQETTNRADLDARFERALAGMFVDYQPIVCWSTRSIFAYEALVRSHEPSISHPDALFDAADRLGRVPDIGQRVRAICGEPSIGQHAPLLFINLHARDLMDDTLYENEAALAAIAPRVVLEITERARIEIVSDISGRIARLRAMGFRIAIDDIGAGYASLTSFAVLEPEFVKLDRALVGDIDRSTTKTALVGAMIQACADLGVQVIGEGVETPGERDALTALGCDLLQGFLFARPGIPFVTARF